MGVQLSNQLESVGDAAFQCFGFHPSPLKQKLIPGTSNTRDMVRSWFALHVSCIQWHHPGRQRDNFHWDIDPRNLKSVPHPPKKSKKKEKKKGGVGTKTFASIDPRAASFEQETSKFGSAGWGVPVGLCEVVTRGLAGQGTLPGVVSSLLSVKLTAL